jgi:ATP-binding cassette subfamily B protein
MGYFSRHTTGAIKKILGEDVERVELFIAHHIPDLAAAIVLPVMTLIYLFILDWRLALAAMIPLPIAFGAQRVAFGGSRRAETMKEWHDSMEAMNGTIVEYVRGMPVIKVFNQTVYSFRRFKESVYSYRDWMVSVSKKMTPPWAAFTVIVGSGLVFILPVGVWLYVRGGLDLSVLLLFMILGAGYMAPLVKLAMFSSQLTQINEGVTRIEAIFDEPETPEPDVPEIPRSYSIELGDVCFSYEEKEVLHDVSFRAEEGTVTALVGPSGAGKTTIAQLLLRFWDVDSGEILIGGVNVKNIPVEELMNIVSFVFQDVFIFHDTVFENIRMGMDGVTRDQVEAAAKAAQAHGFIEGLPQGYDTLIGEGGTVHLSGGEAERISIARAILKNAPIIVLDEATAFADPENEARIQDAFSELMEGKTVVVIAHRLSSITDADQIIVLDEGRVAGVGSHGLLLDAGGLYQSMWEAHTAARGWELEQTGER